jgi:preprotein translocase subunit SecY
VTELKRRIAFTIGALLLYRFGGFVPLPGLEPSILPAFYQGHPSVAFGSWLVLGASARRLGIFALGITPYVTAAIVVQIVRLACGRWRALNAAGAEGRQRINRLTRYLALLFAAFQSFAVARGIQTIGGIVIGPHWLFPLTTTLTMTGATMFLVWLSEQITLRGLGNGVALLLVVPILTALPERIDRMVLDNGKGVLPGDLIGKLLLAIAIAAVIIVVVEQARRLIPIRYGQRQLGAELVPEQQAALSLKLNGVGIMPVLLASVLMNILIPVLTLAANNGAGSLAPLAIALRQGQAWYLTLYGILIFGVAWLYAAYLFNPERAAEQLQQYGGTIESASPGAATAAHLDGVVSRLMLIGACYLVLVVIGLQVVAVRLHVAPLINGTALLLLVCITLDISAQVRELLRRRR